jgi:excisionase family DNA binding protein
MSHTLLSTKVLFSRKEFSLLTGLSLRTTASLLSNGEIRSILVGRRRLIPRIEVEEFGNQNHSVQGKKLKRKAKTIASVEHRKVGR